MKIEIGKYKIKQQDEYNLVLSVTVPKGIAFDKGGEGTTDKFVGYYTTLSGAMSKIMNTELLNASKMSDEYLDAEGVIVAISAMEDRLKHDIENMVCKENK